MTPPSRERSGPRKPAKTPSRTAAFREVARGIVAKDRYDRRLGFSVDTAGAIARALERAYVQGFSDAQTAPSSSVPQRTEDEHGPIEWVLIPPRPRNALWTICLFRLGRRDLTVRSATGRLYPAALPNGRPGWRLVTDSRSEDEPFSESTLYQPPYVVTCFAHSRVQMEAMRPGMTMSLFQASQQASTMSS